MTKTGREIIGVQFRRLSQKLSEMAASVGKERLPESRHFIIVSNRRNNVMNNDAPNFKGKTKLNYAAKVFKPNVL